MGINNIQSRFILIIPFILAVSMVNISCEGPVGPQGETGPEGPEGPVGPAGAGGAIMLAGNGEPHQNLGNRGDFYIDLAAGNLYGPKTEDSWGEPLSLQGAQGLDGTDGSDGEDGSQIYAGDGAPANSLGEIGDYYLDRENFHLYGPKTESGWGEPLDLQGPPGTANVYYSGWLDRVWNSLDNPNWKQMSIDEPAVTEELLNTGVILVYVRGLGPQVFAIPFVEMVHSYRFFAFTGSIELVARSTDGSDVDADWITHVRYVLIPGGVPLKLSEEILKDYEQVKEIFNLPD